MTENPLAFFQHSLHSLTPVVLSLLEDIMRLDQQCTEIQSQVGIRHNKYMAYLLESKGKPDASRCQDIIADTPARLEHWAGLQQRKRDLADRLYEMVNERVQLVDDHKSKLLADIAKLEERLGLPPSGAQATDEGPAGQRISGRGGRRASTAPEASGPPPTVPPHFQLYTFRLPDREPFTEWVDPNEPQYCKCRQPSQGKMIGCENDDCRYEWFHYACVGVTDADAAGAWWCPDCRASGLGPKRGRRG